MPSTHLTDALIEKSSTSLKQVELYDSGYRGNGSFGVRLTRGGSKVFFFIYRVGGSRRRTTLGHFPGIDVESARKEAYRLSADIDRGKDPRGARLMSFEEACRLYLEHHVSEQLKATTAEEYRRIIENEILPKWRTLPINAITPEDVSHLLARITLVRKRATLATRVRSVIGSFFSFAKKHGLVLKNPVPDTPFPRSEPAPERILSIDELRKILAVLDGMDSLQAEALRFMIYTGQNSGQVTSMSWSDLRAETWYVGGIAQHPLQMIPFPPVLIERIRHLKDRTGAFDFVFGTSEERHIAHLGRFIADLNQRLKFEQPFSPRDIRRTFQLRLRELGVRPDVIEKIQGRQTSLPPRMRPFQGYDYSKEIESALILWSDHLKPSEPGPKPTLRIATERPSSQKDARGAKIIEFFPKRPDGKD